MNSTLDDSLDVGSPEEELAHTFRQRRLTYSKHHLQGAAAAALLAEQDLSDIESDEDSARAEKRSSESTNEDGSPPPKRIKAQPPTQTSPLDDSIQKRILHAGELTKSASAAPAHHNHHHNRHHHKSKWRQRFSFCSTAPDTALPFPRHVVGTYSCHGMEPVYDSDYDHDQGGESNDEEADRNDSVAKINQDRGGVAYPYAGSEYCALFGVYDGHGEGGEMVSQYALWEVQRLLEERLIGLPLMNGKVGGDKLESIAENDVDEHENNRRGSGDIVMSNGEEDSLIKKAFHDTFIQVDRGLLKESDIEPIYSGTTACVALLRHNKLYISNAGDSRAVLAKRNTKTASTENDTTTSSAAAIPKLTTVPLSVDQNPDSAGEKERILTSGGFVSPPPEPGLSARVWLDSEYTQIGLAMARSIGDHAVKDVGVIAEPVVTVHDIGEEDQFIILATDGVWEFMESEDAVNIVSRHLYCEDHADNNCASKACEALIKAAMAKWHEYEGDYRDDITAIVIRLKDIWKYH